jgi:hypothetical protein
MKLRSGPRAKKVENHCNRPVLAAVPSGLSLTPLIIIEKKKVYA